VARALGIILTETETWSVAPDDARLRMLTQCARRSFY
jgi:hypothetical protein